METTEVNHTHGAGGARLYASIWAWLIALTATEVVLAYAQLFPLRVMLFVLLALSVVKAGLIMAYFMHLRFERVSLALSLLPALVGVICLLFAFFPDGVRLFELRPR